MSDDEQLSMLTADAKPTVWVCPTCRGSLLEPRDVRPCRVCEQTGRVDYDPDDVSEFGF